MNSAGEGPRDPPGEGGRRGRKALRRPALALGSALVGAGLLLHGEEAGPPAPGGEARPVQPRLRAGTEMPGPAFGLYGLTIEQRVRAARPEPVRLSVRHRLEASTAAEALAAGLAATRAVPAAIGVAAPVAEPVLVAEPVAFEPEPAPAVVAGQRGALLDAQPEVATKAESVAAEPAIANGAPVAATPLPAPEPTVASVAVPEPVPSTPAQAPVVEKVPPTPVVPTQVAPKPAPVRLAVREATSVDLPKPQFGGDVARGVAPVTVPAPKPVPAALAPPAPVAKTALATPAAAGPSAPAPAAGTGALVMPKPAFGGNTPGAGAPVTGNAAALTGPGAPPMAGFVPAAPFTTDDELILQFETAHGEVSETMTAYGTRSGVYLPLGEIARLLDLAIVVSDEGRYAAGWAADEKRTLSVNLREGKMRVDGREIALGPREATAFEGELFLRADRFADLLPLTLKVDLRAQTVAVKTTVPLPFEQRAEREAMREKLGARGQAAGEKRRYPREPTPYRAATMPIGDVELRTVSDTAYGTRGEADIRLAGDLAFMTARVFASTSTRDGLTAARIMLGRRDPDAALLGPLKATEFAIGDVSTTSLPVGLRGVGGRGAMVSNTPLERLSVFDRIDLRGELPAGYEAELYRNDTLVGSTRTQVNGQYEFLQVPVEFGVNVFRLVLYGPQGQRRESVRRISVGDGRLAKGEFLYSAGIAQKDINLLNAQPPNFTPGQDYGAWRASGLLQYGVTTGLTAVLGGAWYQSRGSNHWLASAGVRTGIGGLATRLDVATQDGHGEAVTLGLGGRFAGANWTATHAEYFGRFSDEARAFTTDALRRASEFNLNATLRFGSAAHPRTLPVAGILRAIEYADGRSEMQATLRGSMAISRVLVSNAFDFGRTSSATGVASTRLAGTFDLATLAGSRTQYRGSLSYSLAPEFRVTAVQAEVNRSFGKDTLVKAAVGHLLATGETTLGLSAVRRFDRFSLAFDGNVSLPTKSYAAILRLGFSFGRNPLSERFFVARPGMANGGAVAVRAFADENGNRRFDAGEPTLEGVEFDTGAVATKTGRDGVALLGAIGDGTRVGLHVNSETLPDIAMAPLTEGIELVPRAGRIHAANFAIVALSDVEGTARFGAGGKEVSGLHLLLLDGAGKVVAKARTGGGGTFLFEQVRPGDYRLAIEPGQARRLGIALVSEAGVRIGAKASVVRMDLRIAAQATE